MSKRVLRTMTDGALKTALEMDANADVVRQLMRKGFVERLPTTYRITEAGAAYVAKVPMTDEARRAYDNARKAKQRRALGLKEYAPRTAETRYPKHRKPKETKAEAVERVLRSASSLPNSVFALGGM